MAKGYWGRSYIGCMCSKSGPKAKFCCMVCGHVCKAPHDGSPVCPTCRIPLIYMGDKWRPMKKKHWRKNAVAAALKDHGDKMMRQIWKRS